MTTYKGAVPNLIRFLLGLYLINWNVYMTTTTQKLVLSIFLSSKSCAWMICCFDDVLFGLIPGPLVIFFFIIGVSPSPSWLPERLTTEVAFRMNWIDSQMDRVKDIVYRKKDHCRNGPKQKVKTPDYSLIFASAFDI